MRLHYPTRYLIVVVNGTKNPHRSAVAKDIINAILETRASKGVSAIYRSKEDQESRLTAAFKKWSERPEVWSAAAPKVSASCRVMVEKLLNELAGSC